MKTNVKRVQKYRRYSEDFKRKLVSEFESGKFSVVELEWIYGIGNSSIYRWIYKFSNFNEKDCRVVEYKSSSSKKLKDLEKEIFSLKAKLEEKQILIDYLEKLKEVADDELKTDIKKKSILRTQVVLWKPRKNDLFPESTLQSSWNK